MDLGKMKEFVGHGAGVWWGQGAGEPESLVNAVIDCAKDLAPGTVRAFSGMTFNHRFRDELPLGIQLISYGALGELRRVAAADRLEVLPVNYSGLARLFSRGHLPSDIGLLQVSPPDRDGRVSLGVAADYFADFIQGTTTLIAEINHAMPFLPGAPSLPLDSFAATVEVDRPLATMGTRAPDDVDQAIARHVAELIDDGATLQLGVGSLPSAILNALSSHEDLGIHSGMIGDSVLDLVSRGVITGARKEIDPGVIVTGSAMGSSSTYQRLGEASVALRPASYTHDPANLSKLTNLVSINSALEVDLVGQIGSESVGGRYLGAIGGQADFSRAAAQSGAVSIIALRSTNGRDSTIRSILHDRLVATTRADVDAIVTENGVAHMTGKTDAQRARALISIAADQHRYQLTEQAIQHGYLPRIYGFSPSQNTATQRGSHEMPV